jgi:hypothetical protein
MGLKFVLVLVFVCGAHGVADHESFSPLKSCRIVSIIYEPSISATEGRTVSKKISSSRVQDVDSFLGIENAAIYILRLTTSVPLSLRENLDDSLQNGHQYWSGGKRA